MLMGTLNHTHSLTHSHSLTYWLSPWCSLVGQCCLHNTIYPLRLLILLLLLLLPIDPITLESELRSQLPCRQFVLSDGGCDNWSYKTKNVQKRSQIITTNKSTPNCLQAGCPSCRRTNSIKALKGKWSSHCRLGFPWRRFPSVLASSIATDSSPALPHVTCSKYLSFGHFPLSRFNSSGINEIVRCSHKETQYLLYCYNDVLIMVCHLKAILWRSACAKITHRQNGKWNCYYQLLTLTPIPTQIFCDSGPLQWLTFRTTGRYRCIFYTVSTKKRKPKFLCYKLKIVQKFPSNLARSYSNLWWIVCVKTIHFTWRIYTHYLVMLREQNYDGVISLNLQKKSESLKWLFPELYFDEDKQ